MNISALTDDELMRVISPSSELEVLLMQRLEDALRRADHAEEESSLAFEDHECDCEEENYRIQYLEGVLDKHEIKYNK